MAKSIKNRRDILLLLLYSPGITSSPNEPVAGRTRLTKMIFLFKKELLKNFTKGTELTEGAFYEFFAWNFGPFSKDVYDDLSFFQIKGFIETSSADDPSLPESAAEWSLWLRFVSDRDSEYSPEYIEDVFRLTSARGIPFAEQLYTSLSDEQKSLLHRFKRKMQNTPLRAILEYVYTQYPDMAERSTIKDKVLPQWTLPH